MYTFGESGVSPFLLCRRTLRISMDAITIDCSASRCRAQRDAVARRFYCQMKEKGKPNAICHIFLFSLPCRREEKKRIKIKIHRAPVTHIRSPPR